METARLTPTPPLAPAAAPVRFYPPPRRGGMGMMAIIVLVVVIIAVIGIVYYYYTYYATEEEEKEDEEEEDEDDTSGTTGKTTALDGYTFRQHKDPSGDKYDLIYRSDLAGDNESLAQVCTDYGTACFGFNTQGYLKNALAADSSTWMTKWTDQPTMGYYQKN